VEILLLIDYRGLNAIIVDIYGSATGIMTKESIKFDR
jgi:hypothetical protein